MIKWFDGAVPCLKDTIITIGNFDGLHLGHRQLLTILLEQAAQHGLTPVVLTYHEHTAHFLHHSNNPLHILTPRMCKQQLIRELGFEHVYFLNFTEETAHVSAYDFLRDIFFFCFHPKVIVSGYDSHFGYKREGNAAFLRQHQEEFGYTTLKIPPVYFKDNIISSSHIRNALHKADIASANAMLGKPYRLYGSVTHGRKIGQEIGFPTINLKLWDEEQLVPASGVYLTSLVWKGKQYFGLTNIGISPTLKNSRDVEIETHILDFCDYIYEETVHLDFLAFIRKERTFDSAAELVSAIRTDIAKGIELSKTL